MLGKGEPDNILFHRLLKLQIPSFGPDPYLNGEGAYETIIGVQSVGVQACAKHFIANNQEHWRYGYTSNIDDRTLHEIYFYPFLRSIEVGIRIAIAAEALHHFPGRRCFCYVCVQPL